MENNDKMNYEIQFNSELRNIREVYEEIFMKMLYIREDTSETYEEKERLCELLGNISKSENHIVYYTDFFWDAEDMIVNRNVSRMRTENFEPIASYPGGVALVYRDYMDEDDSLLIGMITTQENKEAVKRFQAKSKYGPYPVYTPDEFIQVYGNFKPEKKVI